MRRRELRALRQASAKRATPDYMGALIEPADTDDEPSLDDLYALGEPEACRPHEQPKE